MSSAKMGSPNVGKKMEEKYVNKRLKDVVNLDRKEIESLERAPIFKQDKAI